MKKRILMLGLVAIFSMFCLSKGVSAANIASCNNTLNGVIIDEKIPNIVSTIVTVIKIVVPVLLVIFGMLDLVKATIASKEDEAKKAQQLFIKRLISGALVFFVFTIVQLIISFVADEDDEKDIMTCANCFLNGKCTYEPTNGSCDGDRVLSKDGKYCIE